MTTPHKEAIPEKAKELFMEHSVRNGIEPISPTLGELKESGFVQQAVSELMQDRNRAMVEQYFYEDQIEVSGFKVDLEELTKTGFYVSGTSGIGKSDVAMYVADILIENGIVVFVFDSSQDWIERSSIPYYVKIEPNVRFRYELNEKSILFDIHALNPEQRLKFVEDFCGNVYRHQACKPKTERKSYFIIWEESQTYLWQGSMRSQKSRNIRMVITEGRNYGIRFGCVAQFASMLDKDVLKFMKQRYLGSTNEKNDVEYIRGFIGKEAYELRKLQAGQFLYSYPSKDILSKIEIEPFKSRTKPQPLVIPALQSEIRKEDLEPRTKPSLLQQIAFVSQILAVIVFVATLISMFSMP